MGAELGESGGDVGGEAGHAGAAGEGGVGAEGLAEALDGGGREGFGDGAAPGMAAAVLHYSLIKLITAFATPSASRP